ncbi:MAG: phosphoribosyltransferase [Parachlamydiales bacterium]|nr:phosphoribosyltransferase [Parachlamydiales bacterium]
MEFKNRKVAGELLAKALEKYRKAPKTICIGLPRGGVVVAAEAAKILEIGLDIIVPRKIGAPHNEELAIGALAGDVVWIDPDIAAAVGASPQYIEKTVALEKKEAERRLALYRKGKSAQNYSGWTVILIDDGIATGSTMRASIAWMKKLKAARIIMAVPVAPPNTLKNLSQEVDDAVCLYSTENFYAVGQFYEDFPQVEDREVIALLSR